MAAVNTTYGTDFGVPGLRTALHRQLDVVLDELVRRRGVGDEQKERRRIE